MSFHTTVHQPIRRLRELLGHTNNGCDRCNSDRECESERGVIVTFVTPQQEAINQATVFEQVARRQIRPTYGMNRQFYSYPSYTPEKMKNFPLAEGTNLNGDQDGEIRK